MTHSRPGVAYPLWRRITELSGQLGLNKTELEKLTGVRKATLDAWRTAKRCPQSRTVTAVAVAINQAAEKAGMDLYLSPDEALRLAGVVPQASVDDVRQAISQNSVFTDAQRVALLGIVDTFVQQNAQNAETHRETGSSDGV
jgi:hypothetical protein